MLPVTVLDGVITASCAQEYSVHRKQKCHPRWRPEGTTDDKSAGSGERTHATGPPLSSSRSSLYAPHRQGPP